jgi:DNA-binding HxlR family transcriptional regulator
VTQEDAERQLGRVDGFAKRFRSTRIVATIALGLAMSVSVVALLAWVPGESWSASGSFLPLLISLGLVAALLALAAAHRGREGGDAIRRLVREAEVSAGLREGELTGARELRSTPGSSSSELAELQRLRVARILAGFSDLQLIPEQHSVARRRFRLSLGAAALALLALLLSFALRPAESRAAATALARSWQVAFPPLPPRMRIELLGGPVLRGEPAVLRVQAPGRALVSLAWQSAGETPRRAGIAIAGDGTAVGRTGAVDVPMSIWVLDEEGRASDTLRVVPVDPLLTTTLAVITVPPSWSGGTVDTVFSPIPELSIETGTVVEVFGTTNHPLRAASLVDTGRDSTISLLSTASGFSGELRPGSDEEWRFDFLPAGEVPGIRPPPPLRISVLQDRPPEVRVIRPGRDLELIPEAILPIVIDASDDIGLRSIDLEWWRISAAGLEGARSVRRLAELDGEPRRIIQEELDLIPLGLVPGDTLFYRALARDRNPATPASVSSTWKVVVPSISDLRRHAAKRTAELAEQTGSLSRGLRQLQREASEASAGMSATRGDASGFESTEQARSVESQGRDIERRLEELERDLAQLGEGLESMPAGDPDLRERIGELGAILEELRQSGLSERMRELEEALRKLNRTAARDALQQVARSAEELARQVDETADLMERVAAEQALKDAATSAADLAEAQSRAAETVQNSADWAAEEEALAEASQALANRMEKVRERLDAQGADAVADSVSAADSAITEAVTGMRDAAMRARSSEQRSGSNELSSGDRSPSQAADAATASLEEAARKMDRAVESLQTDWKEEAVAALDEAAGQALDLAGEQARLSEQMAAGSDGQELAARQEAIGRGLDQVLEKLSQASRRTALVDRRTGPTAARTRRNMEQLSRELSEGLSAPSTASSSAMQLAEDLNELSGRLRASRRAMESSESGTGMEEALEQLARMSEAQAGLNRDAGGLLMLLESGPPRPADLSRITERQEEIAKQLAELAADPASAALPTRPDALAEEAGEIARSLTDLGLDRETLRRQERLFRSLLDAGRSLERDPDPERRESLTATGGRPARPVPLPDGALAGPRFPYPDEGQLKDLSPPARRLILDYFDRLNRDGGRDR